MTGFHGILAQTHVAEECELDYESVWEAWTPMHVHESAVDLGSNNGAILNDARGGEVGADLVNALKIAVAVSNLEREAVSIRLMKYNQLLIVLVQALMKNFVMKHHANEKLFTGIINYQTANGHSSVEVNYPKATQCLTDVHLSAYLLKDVLAWLFLLSD